MVRSHILKELLRLRIPAYCPATHEAIPPISSLGVARHSSAQRVRRSSTRAHQPCRQGPCVVRPSLRGKEARQKSASAPRTRRGCVLRLPLAWVLGDPHGPLAHGAPASQSFPKNINLSRTAESAADERSEDNGLVEAGVKTDVRKRDEPGSSRKKPLKRLRAIVSNWPALEVDAVTGSESSRQFGMKRLRDTTPGASTLGKVLNGVRSQRAIAPAAADETIYLVGKRIERRLAAARFQPVEDTLFTRCPRSPGYNTRPDRERLVKNQLFDRALPAITLQHIADDGFIDAVLGRRNRPSIASRLRRVAGVKQDQRGCNRRAKCNPLHAPLDAAGLRNVPLQPVPHYGHVSPTSFRARVSTPCRMARTRGTPRILAPSLSSGRTRSPQLRSTFSQRTQFHRFVVSSRIPVQ